MRGRTTRWFALALGAAATTLLLAGGFAGAEDEAGGGMPPPQKKVDQPALTDWVGTWDFVGDAGKGASTVKLAVGDTAVVEDLSADMGDFTYAGHGVTKVGADGKSVTLWWFDNVSPEPEVFRGTIGPDGIEAKSDKHRITRKKTATGYEFKMFEGENQLFASQYTRGK
jgi:hypothetical protein